MVGIDTNVLVRYFAQDDEEQSIKANELMESLSRKNQGFISMVVIVELVWVTQGAYGLSKEKTIGMIDMLLMVDAFRIENAEIINKSLKRYKETGADFSDCVIESSAIEFGCLKIFTFDKKASRKLKMNLL